MSYIKYLSKDFQEALDAGKGEVIGSKSVADVDLKCGLLGEAWYSMRTSA